MKRVLAGLVLLIIASFGALAEEGDTYLTFGLTQANMEYRESGLKLDWSPILAEIAYGKQLGSNFIVEGRLGLGFQSDSADFFGYDFEAEVENLMGVMAKFFANEGGSFRPYAGVGYNRLSVRLLDQSTSESKPMYAVGADFAVGDRWDANLEWGNLYRDKADGGEADITAIKVAFRYNF